MVDESGKYVDSFEKYIVVPKNNDGIIECKTGDYRNNVEFFDISQDEFKGLYESKVADQLNSIDGVMFDEYESDFIPFEKLGDCLRVFRESEKYRNCEFAKAIKAGLNYGFGIYTEF